MRVTRLLHMPTASLTPCATQATSSSVGRRVVAVDSNIHNGVNGSSGVPHQPPQSLRKLISSVDSSVNYIQPFGRRTIESRYVRRAPDSISVYVSSHNGCKMKCKFCWLTAQGQTDFQHVGIDQFVQQVRTVLQDTPNPPKKTEVSNLTLHHQPIETQGEEPLSHRLLGHDIPRSQVRVNINFMSRGEALANKHVINSYNKLYSALESTVREFGFASMKMNLSTIMPHTIRNRRLSDIFKYQPVSLFYSLYSMSPSFRAKWLPNAISPLEALDQLKQLQLDYEDHFRHRAVASASGDNSIVVVPIVPQIHFHWAFIEGENDMESEVLEMIREIKARNFIQSKFNLVRFNPHPSLAHRESDPARLERLFSLIQSSMNHDTIDAHMHRSRIIPRAGPDVFASCGMFQKDYEEEGGGEAQAVDIGLGRNSML